MLREEPRFLDGTPGTAADVAFTYETFKEQGHPQLQVELTHLDAAEAADERTVTLRFNGNQSDRTILTVVQMPIISKAFFEANDFTDTGLDPVLGSGPYKVADWRRGSEITLEAVADDVGFDRIVWRIIPEASTRSAELMAGNVDIITNVAPDQMDVINGSGTAEVNPIQGTRRMYVGFNLSDAMAALPGGDAIQDPDVRRALQYAVDVPTICAQLLNFECTRMTGIVNPQIALPDIEPYPYDPATAERLLDEAGWPRGDDGTRFSIRFQAGQGRYLNDVNVVQAIAQYLSDVGLDVDLEIMEWSSVYIPLVRERNVGPLYFIGSGGAVWSPLYDMTDLARIESGTNYTHWDAPRWFDRWADISAAETDEEVRAIVNDMLQVFYDDGPWLHMYFQPDFYGVSNRLDWTPRPDEKVYLWNAGLK